MLHGSSWVLYVPDSKHVIPFDTIYLFIWRIVCFTYLNTGMEIFQFGIITQKSEVLLVSKNKSQRNMHMILMWFALSTLRRYAPCPTPHSPVIFNVPPPPHSPVIFKVSPPPFTRDIQGIPPPIHPWYSRYLWFDIMIYDSSQWHDCKHNKTFMSSLC